MRANCPRSDYKFFHFIPRFELGTVKMNARRTPLLDTRHQSSHPTLTAAEPLPADRREALFEAPQACRWIDPSWHTSVWLVDKAEEFKSMTVTRRRCWPVEV